MSNREMVFEVSGRGNIPLVCVHGWACGGDQFQAMSQSLTNDFRVFRLDLPGHGRTPLNKFKPAFESYAQAVKEFILIEKLEHPVLLGHSMGGVVCLMAASLGNLQPRAVINLDGSLPAAIRLAGLYPSLQSMMAAPDRREQFASLARQAFFLESERDSRCEAIVKTMCSAPDAVLRFVPEQAGDLKPEIILPKVHAPVLYIGASQPRFDAVSAASLISQFTCRQILDAGHFFHIYALPKLIPILDNFFQSIAIRCTRS